MKATNFKLSKSLYLCLIANAFFLDLTANNPFEIRLKQKTVSNDMVHPYMSPIVGDMDGDSIAEIVIGGAYTPGKFLDYGTDHFFIFQGNNLQDFVKVAAPYGISSFATSPYALARGMLHGVPTSLIFVAGMDDSLRAYNKFGEVMWTQYMGHVRSASVSIADINNDSIPEILVLNAIFSFSGAVLIKYNPKYNRGLSHPAGNAVDINQSVWVNMDDDPALEYVAGNTVYKVRLTNLQGCEGNSMTPSVVLPGFGDGCTVVADMDGDGDPDIVVSATNPNEIYIWDGQTPTLMAQEFRTQSEISVLQIADLNHDGLPEIIACTKEPSGDRKLKYAIMDWQYDPEEKKLVGRWKLPHNDLSGCTGMTLFDFDGDGDLELCYRDYQSLRIINASAISHLTGDDTSIYDFSNTPCGSATAFEYPVIANVDKDPGAEIIVSGDPTMVNKTEGAALMILGSKEPGTWSPARGVWNQFMYNGLHVNDDLTIPSNPINPADYVLDRNLKQTQPYNSFLCQYAIVVPDSSHERVQEMHWGAQVSGVFTRSLLEECDVDEPYTKKKELGLDTEKNELQVYLSWTGSTEPTIQFHSDLITPEYYTWTKDLIPMKDDESGQGLHHAILTIRRSTSYKPHTTGRLNLYFSTSWAKDSLAILFSDDFDDDGFSNYVERASCTKYTRGVFNEWYPTLPMDDADEDGLLNCQETDCWDSLYSTDFDRDGIPNFLDLDSNGDGVPDYVERTDTLDIHAKNNQPYVRPAISPNGDGMGCEHLYIENINKYPQNEVTIFDVNGTILFQEKNYDNYHKTFPEKRRSERAIARGTYYYVLNYYDPFKKRNEVLSGFVVVRR